MRFSLGTTANVAAWAGNIGLACGAVVMVTRLGSLGLVLLGLLTLFVCTRFSLDQDAPTWGTEVFKARMANHKSPEQRAAMVEERQAAVSPLRFYRWCGILLTVARAAGFVWQQWQRRLAEPHRQKQRVSHVQAFPFVRARCGTHCTRIWEMLNNRPTQPRVIA